MYKVCLLKKNDCYASGRKITVQGIMVHSTGANNPNVNRYVPIGDKYSSMHWNKGGIQKCVHGFLGKMPDGSVDFVQTLPWNMRGWHSGPNSKPGKIAANNTHIGFECCEDDLKDAGYFKQVYEKAVEVCAYLCKEFNLNPLGDGVIISHHEGHIRGVASNHADIDHWLKRYNLTMDDFRNDVAKKMKGCEGMNAYKEFKENMAKYEQELSRVPMSDWMKDREVDVWVSKAGISDGARPAANVTREEVWMMLKKMEARIIEMFGKE